MFFRRFSAPLSVFMILICLFNCGGNTGSVNDTITEEGAINTEKLIGTPFEGLIIGDIFDDQNYFMCGSYQTSSIESFPIYIFAAFFSPSEESIIQEGVDLANSAMGFVAYELTNTWSDELRIIYKVTNTHTRSDTAIGTTFSLSASFQFQYDPLYLADYQIVDWAIEVTNAGINKWTIAHEIGHATGLDHSYFSFDTFEESDLEENSIMKSDGAGTELNDYNEMMSVRGQIMQHHLGQIEYVEDINCQ